MTLHLEHLSGKATFGKHPLFPKSYGERNHGSRTRPCRALGGFLAFGAVHGSCGMLLAASRTGLDDCFRREGRDFNTLRTGYAVYLSTSLTGSVKNRLPAP